MVGDLLFTFSGEALKILRAGATPDLLASVPLDAPAYGAELLVQDDRVLVLLPGGGFAEGGPAGISMPSPIDGGGGGAGTTLLLLDVADPTEPALLESLDLDGRYLSARCPAVPCGW